MDKNKIISRYKLTLDVIHELKLKNKPVFLHKGESFIGYGEKTKRIGILLNGLLYATYLSDGGTE